MREPLRAVPWRPGSNAGIKFFEAENASSCNFKGLSSSWQDRSLVRLRRPYRGSVRYECKYLVGNKSERATANGLKALRETGGNMCNVSKLNRPFFRD
jgi:hypothetical protein